MMRILPAALAVAAGIGAGAYRADRCRARAQAVGRVGAALEELATGAARFHAPLTPWTQQGPLAGPWQGQDAPELTEADNALLRRLLLHLSRMSAQSCAGVCAGVCERWQAHARQVQDQCDRDARLWRTLCGCAGAAVAILLL